MRETEGIIERVRRLSPQIQRLEISIESSLHQLQAGQFVLAKNERQGWENYLREKWIPVSLTDGQMIVDRPGTLDYRPGDVVSLIGAVGSPFMLSGGGGKHLLLIADDTPPSALLLLAEQAIGQMWEVALVLLGSAREYPYAGIPAAVEVISGDDEGHWHDQARIMQWADQIFATVNEAFWMESLSSLYERVREAKIKIPLNYMYGVFDLAMPCGTGTCMACAVRCKTSTKLACVDGPALDLVEVMLT